MIVRFNRYARAEIDAAMAYLEAEQAGLGTEFALAVADGIDKVLAWPNAWPMVESGCRRYRMTKFSYGIVYKVANDHLVIYAVAHLRREPGYWSGRVES